MKKLLSILASALCVAAMAGCVSQPTNAVNPADVVSAIASGCLVVQPTLTATATIVPDPNLGLATAVNGVFCTANEAVAAAAVAKAAAAPVAASAPAASK